MLRPRVDVRVLERAAPARVSRIMAEAYEAQSIQLHDPFLSKDELEALEALGIEQAQPPRSAKLLSRGALIVFHAALSGPDLRRRPQGL